MLLWVGLGNPGAGHARQRHNIGFMAVDRIAADHGFGPWRRAFRGEAAEGRLGAVRVLLLKPQTFMNLSGEAVRAALDFHKLAPADVTVFHDEIDLPPFRVRVKAGGGHAGHNGLRSIHQHLGTDGYRRVRLGIGHPGDKARVAAHVLSDFARAEAEGLDDLLCGVSDGALALASGDGAGFLAAVALRSGLAAEPQAPRSASSPSAPQAPRAAAPPSAPPAAAPSAPPSEAPPPRHRLQRLIDRLR